MRFNYLLMAVDEEGHTHLAGHIKQHNYTWQLKLENTKLDPLGLRKLIFKSYKDGKITVYY